VRTKDFQQGRVVDHAVQVRVVLDSIRVLCVGVFARDEQEAPQPVLDLWYEDRYGGRKVVMESVQQSFGEDEFPPTGHERTVGGK